jgi:hypothetical protein
MLQRRYSWALVAAEVARDGYLGGHGRLTRDWSDLGDHVAGLEKEREAFPGGEDGGTIDVEAAAVRDGLSSLDGVFRSQMTPSPRGLTDRGSAASAADQTR